MLALVHLNLILQQYLEVPEQGRPAFVVCLMNTKQKIACLLKDKKL